MKTAELISDTIVRQYSASVGNTKAPRFKRTYYRGSEKSHVYDLDWTADELLIRVSNSLSEGYAVSQAVMGLLSGHLAEFSGTKEAAYKTRALWLEGLPEDADTLIRRLIEMGYSQVVVKADNVSDLKNTLSTLSESGIAVWVSFRLAVDPLDSGYDDSVKSAVESVREILPAVSGFIWESRSNYQNASEYTEYDLIRRELEAVEKYTTPDRLLFYPASPSVEAAKRQLDWIETLCDDAGPNTTIAFSAVAGEPWQDERPLHPIWNKLRQSPDTSVTPLVPILNSGCVNLGGGLWPNLSLGEAGAVLDLMTRHPFDGAVCLSPSIPKMGSLLDANLWCTGQMLFHNRSPHLLLGTWLAAHFPADELHEMVQMVSAVRELSIDIARLEAISAGSQDPAQIQRDAEAVLTGLTRLRNRCLPDKVVEVPQPAHYLVYFIRDAKRMLFRVLQTHKIPLASVFTGDDMGESFWTAIDSGGRGIGFGTDVQVCKEPSAGKKGSLQEQIYSMSRIS